MFKSRLLYIAVLWALGQALALPSFPGAQGWGGETKGGRGGKVYVVTTLASSGPGSFREAFFATGPRTIVFRVSGVIDMQPTGGGQIEYLQEKNSDVTIAGQTSPGGITLVSKGKGSSIVFSYHSKFHDGIFRFLRVRGKEHNEDSWTMNGANDFIFDHMDFSGGSDETLDITASRDYTVQWSTITNSSAGQTYGFLMAYLPTCHISIHHNVLAHHVERYPAMHWELGSPPDSGKIDFRNNICYNAEKYYLFVHEDAPVASLKMNVVGNYYKAGPQTIDIAWFPKMVYLNTKVTAFATDNIMSTKEGVENLTAVPLRIPNPVTSAHTMPAVTTFSAKDAYVKVLDKAGAFPRDVMMTRTIEEIRKGTGQYRKDDDALITTGPQPLTDTDMDGMPDKWETGMSLDPGKSADNILDQDGDGYTNIEEYINDEALALIGEPILNPKGVDGLLRPAAVRVVGGKGAKSLQARQDLAGGGGILIGLPAADHYEGTIEISDLQGRILASLPAARSVAWKAAPSVKGHTPGMVMVRWKIKERVADSALLEVR
ncbi:MAG: hypothetical protein M3Y08_04935 [Fibrobacterota bacterium]|nr:hypothetical protein [Fibrobacterota bacterium]